MHHSLCVLSVFCITCRHIVVNTTCFKLPYYVLITAARYTPHLVCNDASKLFNKYITANYIRDIVIRIRKIKSLREKEQRVRFKASMPNLSSL
jgi:hypothetical protein